ncbi:uncharacterized protein LOC111030543 isoform X2 [Myzus persicae]|uniref:uncharacterized protein LOC111030543 isoform X2 n=1 Tax=Myzus persicae TaxID=13164 RepID=UPI000B9376FA|nr:uncharacterized protein LOC111030543 isoform X2 [Myzus persicae]
MTTTPDEVDNTIDPTPGPSTDDPLMEFISFESKQSMEPRFEEAYLFIILCPPDGGPWALLTCILGFLALLICDGVCLSFFLLDGRLGMVENLPPGTRTFEHLAVIYLFRYLTEPISCAYINRYGFRYCLFFGSILSVTWLALLCSIENTFTNGHYFLAVIGGIMCFTLVFWLLVSTPVTLKLDIDDDETIIDSISPPRSKIQTMAWIIENFQYSCKTLTIQDTIGDRKLFTNMFLAKLPVIVNEQPIESIKRNRKYSNWIYEERLNRRLCIRNVTNMFKNPLIGSRPMYRDDILYDGNISLLLSDKKCTTKYIIEYNEYLMTMTRICSIADVNEEKSNKFGWKCPIAISRVLKCMFNMSIWFNEQFLLMVISEALIHAACLVPFMFIKGPVGQKTSAEAVITLMAGCFGLLYGRGLGHVVHGRSPHPVPLYHVGLALVANGLSLLLCATTTNDISNLLPYFGVFGITFGYYKSIQNAVLYTAFPIKSFNNVCGQISLVRGVSSFVGILIAVRMMQPGNDGRPVTSCEGVYVYAGILMMIGSVCVTVLQQSATAIKPRSVYCKVSAPRY